MIFRRIFRLTDLIVNMGVPITDVLRLLALGLPQSLSLSVPMALVFGVLMTYGRMAQSHELEAMRLAGYSLPRLLTPVLSVGLILTVVLLGIQQWATPNLARMHERQLASMEVENPADLIQPNTYQDFGPFTIRAELVEDRTMVDVHIIDNRGDIQRHIHAESGRWLTSEPGTIKLELVDGTMHSGDPEVAEYRLLQFDKQQVRLNWNRERSNPELDVDQQSLTRLWSSYVSLRFNDSSPNESEQEQILAIHRVVSFPLACFFLVWVAAPLGMLANKSGASIGFSLTLLVVFCYYLIFALAEPLMSSLGLAPEIAAGLPNLSALVIGSILIWRLGKR